jgi:hypothetical protein
VASLLTLALPGNLSKAARLAPVRGSTAAAPPPLPPPLLHAELPLPAFLSSSGVAESDSLLALEPLDHAPFPFPNRDRRNLSRRSPELLPSWAARHRPSPFSPRPSTGSPCLTGASSPLTPRRRPRGSPDFGPDRASPAGHGSRDLIASLQILLGSLLQSSVPFSISNQ